MATVADLMESIQSVDLKEVIDQSIAETAPEYIRLNTEEQLFKGQDTEGKQLVPFYKVPAYARKKNAMNPAPGLGVPDLKLTGSFYQKEKLTVQGDSIQLESDVDHAQYLEKNYGPEMIYGLNDQNQEEYNFGAFQQAFAEKITDQTGLELK